MAITQREQGDYYGAQETSLEALRCLDIKNTKHGIYLSTIYNNLAISVYELKDYEQAIKFYDTAIKYSDDSTSTQIYMNNLARAQHEQKDYKKAIDIYSKVLRKEKRGSSEYARTLANYAQAMWLNDNSYNPLVAYFEAFHIRAKLNDLWGLNSSYARFSDYYLKINRDSSLYYANKQYAIAKKINSADDEIKALERLIKVGSTDSVTFYFNQYKLINDSIQQARAAAKNQFALIRYEVEKNKAENLRLEKENAEKQNRLIRQRVITGASLFLLILVAGGGTLWYKRRKQRLELEAENKVKETQLHLSKKIHDVVANGIYRVMSEIEHNEDVDRDGVLDKLENMYHQSRDISHNVEQQTITEIPYNEQLASLLKSFAADHRRVLIAGNDAEQWIDVSKRIKEEVKHVLQELMVNMKKHSQAEQVVVRFEKLDQQLTIYYKDNGVGMPAEKSQGKGLANTVSRIESLGGKIIFVSEPGKGLSITTNIPL
ncbi:tetratricopeptide repeat-containing sensor histidine kinase [Sphingobacterium detergens]|nr:tetratricopeptide repeat-containing sensor histidine kinase [Sphingobacterium detergens]